MDFVGQRILDIFWHCLLYVLRYYGKLAEAVPSSADVYIPADLLFGSVAWDLSVPDIFALVDRVVLIGRIDEF